MSQTIASLTNCQVGYPDRVILDHFSIQVSEGELIALVGPNGAGKTTLLRTLLGLQPLLKGQRSLLGLDSGRPEDFAGQISYVPQRMAINSSIPVSVKEFFQLKGKTSHSDSQIQDVLKLVDLEGFEERRLAALSGGQVQRVFLAFALLGEAKLIALDEATEGLDIRTEKSFLDLLGRIVRGTARTVIFISHDISAVTDHATRVICLDGQTVYDGDPRNPQFHSCLHDIYGKQALIHGHHHGHGGSHD